MKKMNKHEKGESFKERVMEYGKKKAMSMKKSAKNMKTKMKTKTKK
jgi:hypothetical protein